MSAPLQAVRDPHPSHERLRAALLLGACLLAPASLRAQARATVSRSEQPTDEAALRKALDDYNSGNLERAEPALRALATRSPKNFDANEALGSLYAERGDFSKAVPLLQHAASLSPGQAIAHANLGAAYLKLNKTSEAVHELETAARLEPGNLHTQSNLGQAFVAAQQPTAAARAFGAAVALDPANAELRYNWALTLYQSGALGEAASALDGMKPDAMSVAAHALAGDICERRGEYKEAVLHYQAAAHLDPSAANIYALTVELLRHWTWREALEVATYGATQYPKDTRFEVAKGIALFADGKYPQAAEVFSSLLAVDPNNGLYADLLGRSCDASTDAQATECGNLERFAIEHPENARIATFAAARILQLPAEQQDNARAERLLQQAVAADPKLAEAYYQLGILAQQRLEWQKSATALEKAVALRPSYAEAHYRLSRAYAHLGQREQAQQQIALQRQYSQQEKDALNTRMQEVVTFLLKPS